MESVEHAGGKKREVRTGIMRPPSLAQATRNAGLRAATDACLPAAAARPRTEAPGILFFV